MNSKSKRDGGIEKTVVPPFYRRSIFPRPICLEHCTMNIPNGYENYILKTLKAFSNEVLYQMKNPHKLEGREATSLDIKSRHDKYRLLFYIDKDTGVCKITNLCTAETHKG
jgi:mRNA-degrading endonuclease RelE of RelBE toxin-antitoxin system